MPDSEANRPLSASRLSLALWMLERNELSAVTFAEQLAVVEVTPWRCACGRVPASDFPLSPLRNSPWRKTATTPDR